MHIRGTALLALLALFLVSTPLSRAVAAEHPAVPVCQIAPTWYVPSKNAVVQAEEALQSLVRHRVVLLGEHHDNADHHRWQLHTIAALAFQDPKIALGFEMFPRRAQPVLDAWVNGSLSEEDFLQKIDWESIWSFDLQYYLPMFQLARMYRIPLIALNVDRALFNRVAHDGWDSVPDADREGVDAPAPAGKEYLRYLAGSFLRHNPSDSAGDDVVTAIQGQKFLRFVQGQQLWDRAMAKAIAAVVSKPDSPRVIGIIGSGHLAYRYGVPAQLAAMGVNDVAVALPWDEHFDCGELTPDMADYVFGVKR